jgi:hypothetical protein
VNNEMSAGDKPLADGAASPPPHTDFARPCPGCDDLRGAVIREEHRWCRETEIDLRHQLAIARRAASAGRGEAVALLREWANVDGLWCETYADTLTRQAALIRIGEAIRAYLAAPDADEWAAWSCWCGARGAGEKDYRRHKDNVHASAQATPDESDAVIERFIKAHEPTPRAAEPPRPEAERLRAIADDIELSLGNAVEWGSADGDGVCLLDAMRRLAWLESERAGGGVDSSCS